MYRFSSLVKQNKKAKICFVIYIAGEKKLLFYIYAVIVKQKKKSSANQFHPDTGYHPDTAYHPDRSSAGQRCWYIVAVYALTCPYMTLKEISLPVHPGITQIDPVQAKDAAGQEQHIGHSNRPVHRLIEPMKMSVYSGLESPNMSLICPMDLSTGR